MRASPAAAIPAAGRGVLRLPVANAGPDSRASCSAACMPPRISYAGTLARSRSVTAPEAALGRDGVGSLISHRSRLESTHRLSPIYLRCRYDQYSTVAPPGEPRAVRAAHSIADTVAASARTSASRSQRGCFALRKVGQAKLPARPLGRAHPTWPSLASAPRHARSHIARLCGWLLTLSRRAS